MTQYPLVTVVGGSGFLGRHLIGHLTRAGFRVRVLTRDTVASEYLLTAGNVGQIALQYADITRPETLVGKFDGSWAVINLVSILYESGRQKFQSINVDGARRVAEYAHAVGAARFIQVSALGVDASGDTKYGSTKKAGEDAVRAAFPTATVVRPGLLIGSEDNFFQRFARMGNLAPALPVVGGGKSLMQPTLVTDVAAAIMQALNLPESAGQTYELAGPEAISLRGWMERLRAITNRKYKLVTLPNCVANLIGRVGSLLPIPPMITTDQVKMLKHDNVMRAGAAGYAQLGMVPASVTAAMPTLLSRFVKA